MENSFVVNEVTYKTYSKYSDGLQIKSENSNNGELLLLTELPYKNLLSICCQNKDPNLNLASIKMSYLIYI